MARNLPALVKRFKSFVCFALLVAGGREELRFCLVFFFLLPNLRYSFIQTLTESQCSRC